jgi:hypothetical protein
MSLRTHATITVSGAKALLEPCNLRIRELLDEQQPDAEISEHHGAAALCYDLKVKGGIPFPAFVEASQEFPDLKMVAEWVDVDADARGAATIVNGQLVERRVDALSTAMRSGRPVYVAVDGGGRLELALTFFRSNRDEWLGYALTADRDALLRVVYAPGSDVMELSATDGDATWSLRWRGSLTNPGCVGEVVADPQNIDEALYRELAQMARDFTAEWIWLESEPEEEIAIEKNRYARAGYAIHAANVKASRLHQMKRESSLPEGGLVFGTLGADEAWIQDLVAKCWLENDKG